MEQTKDARVAVKIDDRGNAIGFHILNVSSLLEEKGLPFEIDLTSQRSSPEATL